MTTIQDYTDDCNSLRADIEAKLLADGVTSARRRNSIIEMTLAGLERDKEKAAISAELDAMPPISNETITPGQKRIFADMRNADAMERNAEFRTRRKAEWRQHRSDKWVPLTKRDAERFKTLGIVVSVNYASGISMDMQTVPKKKRHDAIIALMYQVCKYGMEIEKVHADTPVETLAGLIYKYVYPITQGWSGFADCDEVDRLARTVATSYLAAFEKFSYDNDAAVRGGLKSGQVRRDRAEATTWKEVIDLKADGMSVTNIHRQTGVSRKHIYRILETGIRFEGGHTDFR